MVYDNTTYLVAQTASRFAISRKPATAPEWDQAWIAKCGRLANMFRTCSNLTPHLEITRKNKYCWKLNAECVPETILRIAIQNWLLWMSHWGGRKEAKRTKSSACVKIGINIFVDNSNIRAPLRGTIQPRNTGDSKRKRKMATQNREGGWYRQPWLGPHCGSKVVMPSSPSIIGGNRRGKLEKIDDH